MSKEKEITVEAGNPSLSDSSSKPLAKQEPKQEKITWQFRYRRYQTIESYIMKDGKRVPFIIKARNYKRVYDLSVEEDRIEHEALLKSERRGMDFFILDNVKKTDGIKKRSELLEKMFSMNMVQLRAMLTDEEMQEMGLPLNCSDKSQLIMAVIDSKKMS